MEPLHLKAILPNMQPSSEYVKCAGCAGEYTRLYDEKLGLCLDCMDAKQKADKEKAKRLSFLEDRMGSRGVKEFHLNLYKQTPGSAEAFAACQSFNPLAHNLYIYGPCGSGKTHLAGAAWRKRVDEGLKCEFLKHPELSRLFRKKEADEEKAMLSKFATYDALVIDDLGVGRATEFANQILYEILDARISNYKNGLILTTNLSLEDFAAKSGDDRLPSRIAGMCRVIKVDAPDHRLRGAA